MFDCLFRLCLSSPSEYFYLFLSLLPKLWSLIKSSGGRQASINIEPPNRQDGLTLTLRLRQRNALMKTSGTEQQERGEQQEMKEKQERKPEQSGDGEQEWRAPCFDTEINLPALPLSRKRQGMNKERE